MACLAWHGHLAPVDGRAAPHAEIHFFVKCPPAYGAAVRAAAVAAGYDSYGLFLSGIPACIRLRLFVRIFLCWYFSHPLIFAGYIFMAYPYGMPGGFAAAPAGLHSGGIGVWAYQLLSMSVP